MGAPMPRAYSVHTGEERGCETRDDTMESQLYYTDRRRESVWHISCFAETTHTPPPPLRIQ